MSNHLLLRVLFLLAMKEIICPLRYAFRVSHNIRLETSGEAFVSRKNDI